MKKVLLFVLIAIFAISGYSQKIRIKNLQGKATSLKNADIIVVEFTYNDITVGKKKEDIYLKEGIEERNKKDAGTGDKWAKSWKNDRGNRFEPKFVELFNKYSKKSKIEIEPNVIESKYKMIVNTYFIEPGFNVGVHSRPSIVSMTITFVETANPEKIIAKYDVANSRGTAHFDTGMRIMEGYAYAGKSFAKYFAKQLK
jgi:hypothetical protein